MHRVFNKNLLLGYESILDYDSILLNELAHPWLKYGFSTTAKTNFRYVGPFLPSTMELKI